MRRIELGLACVLGLIGVTTSAAAQERLDSSFRAWGDIAFYSGDFAFDEMNVTAITPVLRAELELSSWQLGLDLPFAFASVDVVTGASVEENGFGGRLGDPTLHVDYLTETGALRGTVGLAVAIPTSDSSVGVDADEIAGRFAEVIGAYSRGLWNMWWYLPDVWTLIVPASLEHANSERELGVEGALAWLLPRSEARENQGVLQIAVRAAMVEDLTVVGLRLQGVLGIEDGLLGNDNFQSSAELFAELRLPIVWLGAGLLVVLDEPLGVLGDGADMWNLRVSAGVHF
jgi:hypothetical protein